MNKLLALALAALVGLSAGYLTRSKSSALKYADGFQFCTVTPHGTKINVDVVHGFVYAGQNAYVLKQADIPDFPLQYMAVFPEEEVTQLTTFCK